MKAFLEVSIEFRKACDKFKNNCLTLPLKKEFKHNWRRCTEKKDVKSIGKYYIFSHLWSTKIIREYQKFLWHAIEGSSQFPQNLKFFQQGNVGQPSKKYDVHPSISQYLFLISLDVGILMLMPLEGNISSSDGLLPEKFKDKSLSNGHFSQVIRRYPLITYATENQRISSRVKLVLEIYFWLMLLGSK